MSEQTTQRIVRLDASALAKSACDLAYYRTVIEGLKETTVYNDTQYGTSFHKFTSTMYESNGNFMEAVKKAKEAFAKPCEIKPEKKHLTENHLMTTCLDFWENFAKSDSFEVLVTESGKPLVEVTFDIPFLSFPDVEIRIAGTMDKVGKIKNGAYCIGDLKVTSSWNVEKFLKPFKMLPQLRLYHWALKRIAKDAPEDSIYKKIAGTRIGVFIDGIFAKSGKPTQFCRSDIWFYTPEEELEFELLLQKKVDELVHLFRNPPTVRSGLIEGLCHNGYGVCKYFDLCAQTNKAAQDHIKRSQFKVKEYNPLTFADDNE